MSAHYSRYFILKEAERNMELRGRASTIEVGLNDVETGIKVHIKNEGTVRT